MKERRLVQYRYGKYIYVKAIPHPESVSVSVSVSVRCIGQGGSRD